MLFSCRRCIIADNIYVTMLYAACLFICRHAIMRGDAMLRRYACYTEARYAVIRDGVRASISSYYAITRHYL